MVLARYRSESTVVQYASMPNILTDGNIAWFRPQCFSDFTELFPTIYPGAGISTRRRTMWRWRRESPAPLWTRAPYSDTCPTLSGTYSQCLGSVTFWCWSGSADPYLWLTDLYPTPFFSDCKDTKKNNFSYIFLITHPHAHYLPSLIYCFKDKFFFKILFCKHYLFHSAQHIFRRKGKDPDSYLWLTDLDPGGPKTCGSGSPALLTLSTVLPPFCESEW